MTIKNKSMSYVVDDLTFFKGGVMRKGLEVVVVDVDGPAVLHGLAAVEVDTLHEPDRPCTPEQTKRIDTHVHIPGHIIIRHFGRKPHTNQQFYVCSVGKAEAGFVARLERHYDTTAGV